MKVGIVQFPGSNCDHDAFYAVQRNLGESAEFLWHKDTSLHGADAIILPGGFSYGDYLRTGAIARFSPIMQSVIRFANDGGLVFGICNGFQVLCECGLLPGALLRNDSLRFVCKYVHVKVENDDTPFTGQTHKGDTLTIPVAHGDGNFFCNDDTLAELEAQNRIVFRYCDANGSVSAESNPNGSRNNIAGIINGEGNVLGMMPHPERAADAELMGHADGMKLFRSIAGAFASMHAVS